VICKLLNIMYTYKHTHNKHTHTHTHTYTHACTYFIKLRVNILCILIIVSFFSEKQTTRQDVKNMFCIKEHYILPLYDYVHLQKGVRNNFVLKDILFNIESMTNKKESSMKKYASWDAVETLYKIDKYSFLKQRQMPKLLDKHIFPTAIPKMKVKYAVQILSHTVANFMDIVLTFKQGKKYLIFVTYKNIISIMLKYLTCISNIIFYIAGVIETRNGTMQLPESAAATAKIILFFDELFDSFGKKGQGLSSIINSTSDHIQFWQKALHILREMEFVEKRTHKPLKKNAPKCLKNWIWTIQGARSLWKVLRLYKFSSLNLRYINQDPLENFFSQVRDIGHRNNNPTPYQFSASFKTLLTANITSKHSLSSNCQQNEDGTSLALLNMFRASQITTEENDIIY